MGPRPRGRGNAGHRKGICRELNASMGPRPRGRGNRQNLLLRQAANIVASMGPRPRGRGNLLGRRQVQPATSQLQWGRARAGAEIRTGWSRRAGHRSAPRFNGAAPARARKSCLNCGQVNQALRSACFNGAAPARARKSIFGDCIPALLQWGRARAGAEMPRQLSRSRLQWGRARAGAEITATECPLQYPLQWGRARAGAEIASSACTFTARLQWGRARAGAEIVLLLLLLAQARNT